MISEVRITSLEELMPLLSEQEYRPALKRNRSSYLYRGMPNANWRLNGDTSPTLNNGWKTPWPPTAMIRYWPVSRPAGAVGMWTSSCWRTSRFRLPASKSDIRLHRTVVLSEKPTNSDKVCQPNRMEGNAGKRMVKREGWRRFGKDFPFALK